MIIDEKIKNEKLQYDVNRKAAKISVLSSSKINEYEYLTGEEILPSDQYKIIKKVKFTYSPLGRICKTNKQILFEKQIKTIQDQGIKQVAALKALKPEENQELESIGERFPKKMRNNEIKNEIDEIRRKDLTYETKKYTYDFQQHEALRSFGENTYSSKINIDEAEIDQAIYYKI